MVNLKAYGLWDSFAATWREAKDLCWKANLPAFFHHEAICHIMTTRATRARLAAENSAFLAKRGVTL